MIDTNPVGKRIWAQSIERPADIFIGRRAGETMVGNRWTPTKMYVYIRRPGRPQGFTAVVHEGAWFAGEPL
jgi:hypothetical protein